LKVLLKSTEGVIEMGKFLIIAALAGLSLFFGNSVLAADPAEINELMELAFKSAMPQEGPGGGTMFVLAAENLPRPYGYENIFFRVHDGGNRFYVTMFRKEIYVQPDGGKLVVSKKFVDGGSVVSDNDEFGAPDGKPDRVVFNVWLIKPNGEVFAEPESFIDLAPGSEFYEDYLKLFDNGIAEIQKFYKIKKEPCRGCE
jgi:hypothetical protein